MLFFNSNLQIRKCRSGLHLLAIVLLLIGNFQAGSARSLLVGSEEKVYAAQTPARFQHAKNTPTAFCDGVSEIPQAECQALEALYTSTDGPHWTNKGGWMTTTTPCSWHGITCTEGQISWISLSGNHLNGNIPPQLSNLSNLQFLILLGNQLSGSIPAQLGNLINLYDLNLTGNRLSGSIPPELGNLTNLETLYLQFNQLSGSIPPELGNLSNLDLLHLNDNQLSGKIPPELGNLSKLSFLYVNSNHLSGSIPPEFGNLTALMNFGLENNALSGDIPSTLTNLTRLGPPPWYMISNLGYNRLTASDPAVVAFLNGNYIDWTSTQTLPPIALQAHPVTGDILLSWTPISYTADGGFYEINYAPISTGVYTVSGVTADKSADHYLVTGLTEGTTYSLRVRTYTPAHGDQQNDLWSDYTQPVSAAALYRSSFLPMIPHGDLSTENSPIFPNNFSGP